MSACRHEASAFACATRGSCESLMTCMLQTSMEVPFFPPPRRGPDFDACDVGTTTRVDARLFGVGGCG